MITVESSKGLGILEWFIFFSTHLTQERLKPPKNVLTGKAAVP